MKKKRWRVFRDGQGASAAIVFRGWHVLQLNPGTTRNESMAQEIVDLLNSQGATVSIAKMRKDLYK